MTTRLLRFTTAPAAYDGFSTREEAACVGHDRDKPVRCISFEPKDQKWQEGRNSSGMHFTVDEAAWQKMVAAGFVTATAPAKLPAADRQDHRRSRGALPENRPRE